MTATVPILKIFKPHLLPKGHLEYHQLLAHLELCYRSAYAEACYPLPSILYLHIFDISRIASQIELKLGG